jgi:arginyl-tRNA synthetase
VVTFDYLYQQGIRLSREMLADRDFAPAEIEQISKIISKDSLIYNNLKNDRILDINYDYKQMLSFEGNTAVYVLYTLTRILSILKNIKIDNLSNIAYGQFENSEYFSLLLQTQEFRSTIVRAAAANEPSLLAKYLYQLSKKFNGFYAKNKMVVTDPQILRTNYVFLTKLKQTFIMALDLLGLTPLEKM